MSVVAGCVLLDGVLLTADTRITYQTRNSKSSDDDGMKVFGVAPGTAIGYVGYVEAASRLLQQLFLGLRKRRTDPMSLLGWIPRMLRYEYQRLSLASKPVAFMIASSLEGRPTIVERSEVAKLFHEAVKGGLTSLAGPSMLTLMGILEAKGDHVWLPNTCAGFLHVLRSPNFQLEFCNPLWVTAIGSGEGAAESVKRMYGRLLFNSPELFQIMFLRDAVAGYAERNRIDTVGGLYPVIKVRGDDVRGIGLECTTFKRGTSEIDAQVTLTFENGGWVQREAVSGREVRLRPPGTGGRSNSGTFDYLDRRRFHN